VRSLWWAIVLLFAAVGAPGVLRATPVDITYTVNLTIGAGTATGFITTDGTFGTLGLADILAWNLVFDDGTNTVDLTPSNSITGDGGLAPGLAATAINLTFSFSPGNEFYFTGVAPTHGELCYDAGTNCAAAPSVSLWNVGGDGQFDVDSAVDGEEIMASVPEPRPAVLMLTGIGLVAAFVVLRTVRKRPLALRRSAAGRSR